MIQNPAPVKKTAREALAEELESIKLQTIKPHQLLRDVGGRLPPAVVTAITTGRGELVKLASAHSYQRGVWTHDEVQPLLDLIGALVDTNQALRQHAERVASLVQLWTTQIAGVENLTQRIVDFAHFRNQLERSEEDES